MVLYCIFIFLYFLILDKFNYMNLKEYKKILDPLNKFNKNEINDISSLLNILYKEDSRNNEINNLQNFLLFSFLNENVNINLENNWTLFKILLMRYLFDKENKLSPFILNQCIQKLNENLKEIDCSKIEINIFLFYEIISLTYYFYSVLINNIRISNSIITLLELFSKKIYGHNNIIDNIIKEFEYKFCLNNHISKEILNYYKKKNFEVNFSKILTIKKLIQKKYPSNTFSYPNPFLSKETNKYDYKTHENINIILTEENQQNIITNFNQIEKILLKAKDLNLIENNSIQKFFDYNNNGSFIQCGFYIHNKKYITLKFFLDDQMIMYQSHILDKININNKISELFFCFDEFLIQKITFLNSNYELTFLILNYLFSKYNKLVQSIETANFKKYCYIKSNFEKEKEKKDYPKFNEEKIIQLIKTESQKLINGFKNYLLEYINYIIKSIKIKKLIPEINDEKYIKNSFLYSRIELDNKLFSKKIDDLIEKKNNIISFNLNI